MKPAEPQRSSSELPSLKRFRACCLLCFSVSLVFLLIAGTITVVPRAEWIVAKAIILSLIFSLYFIIIGLRTHVMIYRLARDRPQIFDRPAPEWITLPFLLCAVAATFWPR